MTILISISSSKIRKSGFFVSNLHIFVFSEILQTEKFEDADFKYDNSFLKIFPQEYKNKTFSVVNTQ